jgi:hypothetical protein
MNLIACLIIVLTPFLVYLLFYFCKRILLQFNGKILDLIVAGRWSATVRKARTTRCSILRD